MRKVYRGKDIEVSFDLDQCVHIGECLRGEPRAFQLTRRPWHEGTTVTPVLNGPLLVIGRIEVQREDRTVEIMPRATLCRCGYSNHKPFCDNEHLKIGFKAPGTPMKIHLSPVRPRLEQPITKTADPRGSDVGEHAV